MVGTLAAAALGLVFLAAAATKLGDLGSWPAQAGALGAPPLLVPVVPWWELVLGALLVVGAARPWPAVLAGLTLVAFTVLIVRVLRRGQRPPCACFGGVRARPLGWGHVARNTVLMVLAVVAVVAA
jgi:hypothetical protein